MEKLNWKKAIEDYGKKSSGSAATTKTASPSGVLSWQQAMDEYDQYDDDGYKALGEQRKRHMTQHRAAQKQAQEETAQKQAQKMAEQKAYREYQQALINQQFGKVGADGNWQPLGSDEDTGEQVPRLAYKNAGFPEPRMGKPARSSTMTPDEVFGSLYDTTTTRQESAPKASDGDHSKWFQRRLETYVQAQKEGRSQGELDSYLKTLVGAGDITQEEAEEIRGYRTQYEEVASYSPRELEDNEETKFLRNSLMSSGVLMGLNDSQREYLAGEQETRRQQLQEQRKALEETLRELESVYDDDSEMDWETPEAERVRQVRAELDRVNQELWQSKSNIGSIQMAQNLAQRQQAISAYEVYRDNADFDAVSRQARNAGYSRKDDQLGYYLKNREFLEVWKDLEYSPGIRKNWGMLEEPEIQMYYYLLGSQGREAARRYLDDIQIQLDQRVYVNTQTLIKETYQNANFAGKAAMNAFVTPAAVFGNITAPVGDMVGGLTGKYSPYNSGHVLTDYAQTVLGETAADIQGTVDGTKQLEQQRRDLMKQWVNMSVSGRATPLEQRKVLSQLAQVDEKMEAASGGKGGIPWGKLAANTYLAASSGVQSALGAALFGKGYTVVMGSGAASQRARELWEAGASDVQIGLGAMASGLIEMATEKYSVDYFTENFLRGSIQGPKDWIVKTLIQGFNEGSEEVASEIANMVVNALILGANSDNQQETRELMESEGLSYEEAKKQAYLNRVLDVFWAAYGGFVSGSAMGGTGGGVNYAQQNSQYRAYGKEVINNQAVQELLQRAQESGVSQELYQLAQEKAAQDLEQMTQRQQRQAQKEIGKLYAATVQAQQEGLQGTQREVFRQQAQEKLEGKTDDAQAAAEAVTKAAYGETLTQQEQKTVEEAGGEKLIEDIKNSREFQEAAQDRFTEKARTVADTMGMAEDLTKQRGYIERFAKNNGMDAEVMKSTITRGQNAIEFTNAWQNAYDMGARDIALRYAQKANATSYLTQKQIETAYNEGRKAAGYYEETEAGEGAVPDGGQWNDRADSGGQLREMEGFPGEEGQPGQAEAAAGAAGAAEGVTAIDHNARLGNRNGNVKWLAPEQYSEDARQAEQEAKKNGLNFVAFRGGALTTTEEVNGRVVTVRSRGCVVDGTMYVRVDDNTFTARQIAGHEAAHERIRRGEINVAEAKQRLLERYSKEEIDAIIDLYASAYGDSGLTAQEVLEEILCDAMGQMNAFATEETERVAGEVGVFLRNVRKAAKDTGATKNTTGEGGVKFSREMDTVKALSPVEEKISNVTESQQFKRWFGDWKNHPENASKVVNADGTPKVVYHGTNMEFWEFDLTKTGNNFGEMSEGLFFFTNKKSGYPDSAVDYARNAAKKEGKERIVEAYLDIKKPLRLDSKGYYTPTVFYDKNAEVIYDKYLQGDYDGIIIENSDKSVDDSVIYMVDNPTRIKSATDIIGTFDGSNPDIRYSREMQSMEELRRVNRALERKLETVQRQAAREIQKAKEAHGITKTPTANRDDVAAVARRLLRDYGSKSKLWFIREELQKIADAIIGNPEADFSELRDKARLVADNILQGASYDINWEQQETLKALKKELRGTYITVTDGMKSAMGDWDSFKNRHRYDMHFREPGKGGTAIDTLWDDWADRYGSWLFPEDIANPEDQLQHLDEVLESIAPQWANPYSVAWNQTVDTIANDIMDTLLSDAVRQKAPTDTDRAISRAREEAYQQGLEHANEEWEEFLSLRVQAETEELRQKLEIREGKLEQRYQEREDAIRKEADAAIDRKEAVLQRTIARKEEYLQSRLQKKEAYMQSRLQKKEEYLQGELKRKEEYLQSRLQKKEDYLQRTIERGRERERMRILRAQNAQIRQKIRNLSDKLDRMARNPGKGDTAHAPQRLVKTIRAFCEMLNNSEQESSMARQSEIYDRIKQLTQEAEKSGDTEKYMEELARVSRADNAAMAAYQKLQEVAEEYAKLKDGSVIYTKEVQKKLDEMRELMERKVTLEWTPRERRDEKFLKDTNENLSQIYDALKCVMHEVVEGNKAFSMGEGKRITDMASKWAGEIKQVNPTAAGWRSGLQQYLMKQMSPDTLFSYLSGFQKGNEGDVIQQAFVAGDRRAMAVEREFDELFSELLDSKNRAVVSEMKKIGSPNKKDYVDWGLKDSGGNAVLTSRGMMLQAYMMLIQDDSRRSLVHNGFRLPNSEVYYKGKITESYGNVSDTASRSEGLGEDYKNLVEQRKQLMDEMDGLEEENQQRRDEIFAELRRIKDKAAPIVANREVQLMEMAKSIEGMMTGTERRLVELAHEWYRRSGQMMRDVFLQMYGYEPKLVENYVPIHRDLDSLQTDIRNPSEAQKAMNLENMGSTKERVPSNKPILLTDILVELQQQKSQMARYVGFAQVQKDFNKIWKCQVGDSNIATLVGNRFGKGEWGLGVSGQEYINKYIADVAGGQRDKSIFNTIYGNYAAATLRLNPRVAVSQAASIPTAAAVVGWKNVAVGFAKGLPKALNTDYRNQLAEKNEYFYYRYRGAGGAADMAGITRKGGMIEKAANSRVGKMLFNWCQAVDVLSTGSIMWEMAESKVRSDGLKKTDPGYEDAVNQVYTDIIRKSQPNYSVTERSDLLRDKRGGMKMLTMFKTQSNQNLNILMSASMELNRMRVDLKNGRNGVTEADVKNAQKKVINAYTSVIIGGNAFFVMLRTAMNFILHAVNPYRDDETDEVTGKDIALGMLRELGSSIAGMAALGGQIYDFVIPVVTGEKYYGISDSAIEALSNMTENSAKMLSNLSSGEKISDKQIQKTVESTCMVLGIPAGNARKIVDAVMSYTYEIQNGKLGQWVSEDTTNTQLRARIIKKVLDGDEQGAGDALALLMARSSQDTDEDTEKWILSNTKTQMHEAYKLGDITDTEAIKVMKYLGEEDPEFVIDKWDFQLEHPEVENPSDKLVATYNMRVGIDGDVLIEAYYYKNGHTKEETVAYIQAMKISSADKKKLWDLIKGNWTDKGTPWE